MPGVEELHLARGDDPHVLAGHAARAEHRLAVLEQLRAGQHPVRVLAARGKGPAAVPAEAAGAAFGAAFGSEHAADQGLGAREDLARGLVGQPGERARRGRRDEHAPGHRAVRLGQRLEGAQHGLGRELEAARERRREDAVEPGRAELLGEVGRQAPRGFDLVRTRSQRGRERARHGHGIERRALAHASGFPKRSANAIFVTGRRESGPCPRAERPADRNRAGGGPRLGDREQRAHLPARPRRAGW